jgi:hypothetical protein
MTKLTKTMANQGDGEHNQVKAQASLKKKQRYQNTKKKNLKCLKL